MSLKIDSLKKLFIHELKDLYSAENQILEALPKMAKAASNKDLQKAFLDHLKETKRHVARLEKIFKDFDFKPGGHHCSGMAGLIKEGEEMVQEDAPDDVKDAGLICAAQRVEHYEMAGYGCARTFARRLGYHAVADELQASLDEEGAADEHLTALATSSINFEAIDG